MLTRLGLWINFLASCLFKFFKESYPHSSVDSTKKMHEARILFCFVEKQRRCCYFLHNACSDSHTTKYSGGHESFQKCWWWLPTLFFIKSYLKLKSRVAQQDILKRKVLQSIKLDVCLPEEMHESVLDVLNWCSSSDQLETSYYNPKPQLPC